MSQTWVEMCNGERLSTIKFVVWIDNGEGKEGRLEIRVGNPPCYEGNSNLFERLSFELIKERFAEWGFEVDHIIRGECDEVSVRDCYVYDSRKVPFAVIRPEIFAR
jgi:hypothetical protein